MFEEAHVDFVSEFAIGRFRLNLPKRKKYARTITIAVTITIMTILSGVMIANS